MKFKIKKLAITTLKYTKCCCYIWFLEPFTGMPSKLLRKPINGRYHFERIWKFYLSSVDKNGLTNRLYWTVFIDYSIRFDNLPRSSLQIVTARIVTSQQSCFVGRLSKKKHTLTTAWLIFVGVDIDTVGRCNWNGSATPKQLSDDAGI